MDIANSIWLWLAALPVVLLVLTQAGMFLRRAWNNGKEMGMTEDQLKSALRSGMISAVGPAVAILVGMLALIATVGGPVAWMRLSVIGSVMFEIPAAEFGVNQLGFALGDAGLTADAYATAVWSMTLGASGWLIVSGLFTPQMETLRQKIGGGNQKLIPIISAAAMLGAFAYLMSGELSAGMPETTSVIFGGIVMATMLYFADKNDVQWMREWSLSLAMVVGLVAGLVVQVTVGTGWF